MTPLSNLDDAQHIDDRRKTVWPLLPGQTPRRTFDACCGSCDQGRKPCVTPQACCMADDDMSAGMGAVVVPAVVAFSLACAALLAFLGGWL